MTKHICTDCPKRKVCDWKCLDECKKEASKNLSGKPNLPSIMK